MPKADLIWETLTCDDTAVAALSDTLQISAVTARLLCIRGLGDADVARRFLAPTLDDLLDPFTLTDMGVAVDRILTAIAQRHRIAIHGDYDVDGITSTVILRRALELLGADVTHFIPERMRDGYGLQPASLDRLHADGVLGAVIQSAMARWGLQDQRTRRGRPKRTERLKVGFTFNVKRLAPDPGGEQDDEAEYDSPKTLQAIREAIASHGHEVIDLEATSDLPIQLASTPVDVVFGQVPAAGQQVAPGTAVAIGVSRGPIPSAPKVPNVVGKAAADAVTVIEDAGFSARTYEGYSDKVPAGSVISQFPGAGVETVAGSEVAIEVSKGKAPAAVSQVTVPNVTGKPEADATNTLKNAGLGVETYPVFSSTVAKGAVAAQLPKAGDKVAPGTVVGIAISKGKAPVTVSIPDLVGMQSAEATKAIAALGLKAVVVPDTKSTAAKGTVTAQSPTAGSSVPPESQVVITVAAGPAVKPTPY